ncbi:MAG: hypothetical protein ABJF08_12770 [Nonlabens sp.]|uniref:hypothetical protein n=1 Tax=Nonlabens sp. TaxID=1888209 RepID=UPI0032659652
MKYRKTILINASAAKTGGAETILKTFVKELEVRSEYDFVILSPIVFQSDFSHISFKLLKTNGFQIIYFTILGIRKYINVYKPLKVISFNNLNYLFINNMGVTYFHQAKALDSTYSDFKIKVYRFIINKFLRKNLFIVQSEYIRNKFINSFNFDSNKVISSWPGFTIPETKKLPIFTKNTNFDHYGLLPISYSSEHKNVAFLNELKDFFVSEKLSVLTLLNKSNDIFDNDFENIQSIGAITRSEMFYLYENVDFLIFTSKDETVGLPIFEFLQTGKPAFVYAADYAIEFYNQFNKPKNFILYTDVEDFKILFLKNINVKAENYNYSRGEWNKILDTL